MADPIVQQQQIEYQTGFAPQIAPYGERLLGASEGQIFDYARDAAGNIVMDESKMPVISGFKPYMQYQGDRFAQFTPLQQQAFAGAQAMEAAPQLADASALAGIAGLRALQSGTYNPMYYTPESFTEQGVAGGYMSPYIQSVLDIEKREAKRQSDIAAQQEAAQFARAGAFGGGRQAIVQAERARNLGTQMGDIQTRGLQAAYQQAQQQFNQEQAQRQAAAQLAEQSRQYGAGLGLQGLQTALQGAGQLGNLGQTQFGQNITLNQLQSQYGQQQQQQMQNILAAQYQDFLNAQNYPFKQLGFMSDILRGAPLTQTGTSVYGQAPSTVSQIAGLGTAALGASKLFGMKDGGEVEDVAYRDKPAGLADLAIYNMGR
jgi:hypothetical protein